MHTTLSQYFSQYSGCILKVKLSTLREPVTMKFVRKPFYIKKDYSIPSEPACIDADIIEDLDDYENDILNAKTRRIEILDGQIETIEIIERL